MRVSTQVAARLRTSSRAGPSSRSDGQRLDLGRQHVAARQQASDRAAAPADAQLRVEHQLAVGRAGERLQARRQVLAQRTQRRTQHGLLIRLSLGRVRNEAEALDASEMLALDRDLARFGDRRRHFTLIAQSSYKQRRPSIDKPLRQTLVQHVGKLVLDRARALLPVRGALDPVGPVRNVGPGPDMGDACHQRVDVAVVAFEPLHVALDPVFGQALAALVRCWKSWPSSAVCSSVIVLRKSGHLADFPEQLDPSSARAGAAGTPNAPTGSAGRAGRPARARAAGRHAAAAG